MLSPAASCALYGASFNLTEHLMKGCARCWHSLGEAHSGVQYRIGTEETVPPNASTGWILRGWESNSEPKAFAGYDPRTASNGIDLRRNWSSYRTRIGSEGLMNTFESWPTARSPSLRSPRPTSAPRSHHPQGIPTFQCWIANPSGWKTW